MQYMAQYNKNYASREEYAEHFVNFSEMDDYIERVNAPTSGFTHRAGHNKFSDWNRAEYKKLMGAVR